MKWSPLFCNYSAAGTDAKYESAQTILSVLSHGITSSFRTFVPWGRLSSSSSCSYSFLADLTTLIRIIIPDRLHAAFWISSPLSGFLSIATYTGKKNYPITTLSVPPWYGLTSTYEIRRREELCAILINMSKKVLNDFFTNEPHGLYPHLSHLDNGSIEHASTSHRNGAYSCLYCQNQEQTCTLIERQ